VRFEQLQLVVPNAPAYWIIALVEAMPKYAINTIARESAFIGQLRHESLELTRFVENLNYSDPVRIVRIFRRGFDLDGDKFPDDSEIAFARKFVKNPQALANRAYANRMGNGDESSGDGWRYRGRCPIQITFKDNYRLYGRLVGTDLVTHPDEALVPRIGAAVSCAYFMHNGCNELADYANIAGITKKINPGMAGLDERIALTNHTRKTLEGTR
jgi:putative chitinase